MILVFGSCQAHGFGFQRKIKVNGLSVCLYVFSLSVSLLVRLFIFSSPSLSQLIIFWEKDLGFYLTEVVWVVSTIYQMKCNAFLKWIQWIQNFKACEIFKQIVSILSHYNFCIFSRLDIYFLWGKVITMLINYDHGNFLLKFYGLKPCSPLN